MRIVAIADLHVGSRVALADPDETPTKDAGAPVRAALFERWVNHTSGPWGSPDALIVLGDAVEGKNRRKGGAGTWTTDLLEQADHAADLIKMWKARQVFMIRGSSYHVDAGDSGLQVEEYIGRRLGAEEYPGQEHIKPDRRERSGWHWYLHFDGVTFHVSHHISVSKVFHYQTTPTARQMLQAKLNDQLRHEAAKYRTRIVLRAHAHYYNGIDFSGSSGFVVPCWKGLDEYMLSKGPLDISPDLGFLGFTTDGQGGCHCEKNLFTLSDVQSAPLTIVEHRRPAARGRSAAAGGDRPRTARRKDSSKQRAGRSGKAKR